MSFLHEIVERKRGELADAKRKLDLDELKRKIRDAPPVRPLAAALREKVGLIAELKRRSPSGGDMRRENFEQGPQAYAKSRAVKAVSVLTNATDFGMSIEELMRVRNIVSKPVLRKDFIFEEYQVYEARAFGADALLLMVNVLERDAMQRLFELSRELGLDVLFEAHTKEEIEAIPPGAQLYGINSRKFDDTEGWKQAKRLILDGRARSDAMADPSVELGTFSLIRHLPKDSVKIAESGVEPSKLPDLVKMGYDAFLVGTSILKAPAGAESILQEFEKALDSC